jgi:hypothetical protein
MIPIPVFCCSFAKGKFFKETREGRPGRMLGGDSKQRDYDSNINCKGQGG